MGGHANDMLPDMGATVHVELYFDNMIVENIYV